MKAPKCRRCGVLHWGVCPDIKSESVDTLKKKVRTIPKKVRTIDPIIQDTPKKVRTIRKVSLKEINRGASKHFKDLPFLVTKNGRVIARVEKAND